MGCSSSSSILMLSLAGESTLFKGWVGGALVEWILLLDDWIAEGVKGGKLTGLGSQW